MRVVFVFLIWIGFFSFLISSTPQTLCEENRGSEYTAIFLLEEMGYATVYSLGSPVRGYSPASNYGTHGTAIGASVGSTGANQ